MERDSSPNKVFTGTTENSAVTLNKDRKRKATTEAKEVNMPNLMIIQLQLEEHIVGMTTVSHLKKS